MSSCFRTIVFAFISVQLASSFPQVPLKSNGLSVLSHSVRCSTQRCSLASLTAQDEKATSHRKIYWSNESPQSESFRRSPARPTSLIRGDGFDRSRPSLSAGSTVRQRLPQRRRRRCPASLISPGHSDSGSVGDSDSAAGPPAGPPRRWIQVWLAGACPAREARSRVTAHPKLEQPRWLPSRSVAHSR